MTAAAQQASITDRIQLEVQRAIQRSIKGVEYFGCTGARYDRERCAALAGHHEALPL